MEKLKVGLIGSSQLSFPGDVETQFARSVKELETLAKKLDFELWVYPSTVITEDDARTAAAAAKEANVDFLLAQCTSFSAGAIAPVYARTGIRLGLWAIPEGTKSGAVPFNSFCGINMYGAIIGHYLKDWNVPVKWFYGNAEDELFAQRFAVTIHALSAIKLVNTSKVVLIGGIAPGFDDLYFDERKLLRRFDGLRINRLHEFDEIAGRALSYSDTDIRVEMQAQEPLRAGAHATALELLDVNARVYKAFRDFVHEHNYEALAVSCWPKFQQAFPLPFSVCDVVARLNDDGIVTSCEGDLPSAVSMLLLHGMAKDATMLMDLSAFDEEDDSVLFWHCGPAAKRFARQNGYTLGVNYSGTPHEKGEDLMNASGSGVAREMEFDKGHATVARVSGEFDKFFLADGDFLGAGKPSWHGSRGWMGSLRVKRRPVGAREFINTILAHQFQHHFPIVSGDFTREIMEAAAWLGMGVLDAVPYEDYLQHPGL